MVVFKDHPLSLLVDLYELTMAATYFRHRPKAQATFDLFVRGLPADRSYLIFAGLEDVLLYLSALRFNQGDLDYLERLGFDQDFLTYLGRLRFHGDVWALPEGTVFFPGEPVLRVTGPLIETQIIESFLLNAVNLSTMIATKASRIATAATGKKVFDFSLRRTHGIDAALKAARCSYMTGFRGTSNVMASKLYGIPAVGTMAHSFVMSFQSESDSFRAFFETFPAKSILLVDTYDVGHGVKKAIAVAKEFKKRGQFLKGVRIDSGNLLTLSLMVRRMLDGANLRSVKILASGDLDEFKIESLLKAGAPIDHFGVGTRMGVSSDAPSLDVIYKVCEVTNQAGVFLPTMKLSQDKVTLPGRKQVFRVFDKKGRLKKDVIGLDREKLGQPLLTQVMRAGELCYIPRPLSSVREDVLKQVSTLPDLLRKLKGQGNYPVHVSPGLKKVIAKLKKSIQRRQAFRSKKS